MHGLRKNIKDKIMKHVAFCGKYNTYYAACLKNAVNFLLD